VSELEVRDLHVVFRSRSSPPLHAVDGVSLTLRAGSTVALVGESGSGKSTVVRTLAGLQRPTGGAILLDGDPLRHRSRALRAYRRSVQTVFQDPFASLNPVHTVAHHLGRPLRVHHRAGRGDLAAKVAELLASVNLVPPEAIAAKRPHELSGGQRQRVAIARALAPDPSVLLADEPVSMLDVSIRLEILNLLAGLERDRNLAMLYVTHDLATARHFSEQILVMYRGRIVERGRADEVILHPAHPYTRLLASVIPDHTKTKAELAAERRARQEERAKRRIAVRAEGGCPFRARCPDAFDACSAEPPELAVDGVHTARCWLYDRTAQPAAPSAPGAG
jgi:peptide/nickel transport system ATP-binding protein